MTGEDDQFETMPARIGAKLRALREQADVSRADAARALGLSVAAYVNRETGTTDLKAHELVILGKLFAVPPEQFFAGLGDRDDAPGAQSADLDADGAGRAEEAASFIRLMARIPDVALRRDVAEAIKAIARAESEED